MFGSRVVCIGGLPGIGSVGKVAADYLATALECSTIKPFFSCGFPAQVVISQGLAELLHAELKAPKEKKDLFILCGDAQPIDIAGMYSLAGEILESAKAEGVTDIITLAAYLKLPKKKRTFSSYVAMLNQSISQECIAWQERSSNPPRLRV